MNQSNQTKQAKFLQSSEWAEMPQISNLKIQSLHGEPAERSKIRKSQSLGQICLTEGLQQLHRSKSLPILWLYDSMGTIWSWSTYDSKEPHYPMFQKPENNIETKSRSPSHSPSLASTGSGCEYDDDGTIINYGTILNHGSGHSYFGYGSGSQCVGRRTAPQIAIQHSSSEGDSEGEDEVQFT
jgi:hypothetical protein